mgnify:CR=1 FL=1
MHSFAQNLQIAYIFLGFMTAATLVCAGLVYGVASIVLSAVSAVVVSRWFLGDQPLFRVPTFELTHPSELVLYAIRKGLISPP